MEGWYTISCLVVGCVGVLVFMRIVANEVMLVNSAMQLRQEVEEEEREKARRERVKQDGREAEADGTASAGEAA
jgi:heme exporter protein D